MSYLNEISSQAKRQALILKPKIYDIPFRNKIFVFMFICYYNLNPTFEIARVCGYGRVHGAGLINRENELVL